MPMDRILPAQAIAYGSSGSGYNATTFAIYGSGSQLIPSGDWWIQGTTGVAIQYSTDGGSTWTDGVLNRIATPGGFVASDGFTWRLQFFPGLAGGITVNAVQMR